MWKKLSKEEQLRYYKNWINETLKDETCDSIKMHIVKHAKEIYQKDPEEWSASMRNLIDAFDKKCKINPSISLRLKKMEDKYHKNPRRFTPPPKIQ